jgi:uncharacterized membrane protein
VRNLVQRIRESLFTIPAVVVLASAGAARLTISLDGSDALGDVPLLLSATVGGGRAITAAIAGATITVTAIVVSIMALTSQIAASHYSPRAVSGFLDDRFQQLVIGLVAGTFTFSVLVLASLGRASASGLEATPSASVTLTVVLGVTAVVSIVAYIDHSLEEMRIDAVVPRIAADTVAAIHRQRRSSDNDLDDRTAPEGEPVRVIATRGGWVRSIDGTDLAAALPPGASGRVQVRVGEAVSVGDLLLTVWPAGDGDGWEPPRRLERTIRTARDRSLAADPSYGVRQLVDIGLRALSPGVNDPTTAVDVIQHLKLPIRAILTLDPPSRIIIGPDGQRLFLTEAPSRSDHVHAAFSEIRLASASQPSVVHALIEILADLIDELEHADLASRTSALREEARLVVAGAKGAGLPEPDLARTLHAVGRLGLEDGDEDADEPRDDEVAADGGEPGTMG